MELWFIYAVASVIFAGFFNFIQKVTIERGHTPTVIFALSQITSSVLAFIIGWLFFDFGGAWKIGLLLGLANGATFMLCSIYRMDSLRYIDTAIFFPLYKTAAPLMVVVGGMTFFGEHFSTAEWIGIALGIAVPLMLLHKSENARQNNLWKGMVFLLLSAVFSAVASGISKYGVNIFASVFVFIAVSHAFGAVSSIVLYFAQAKTETPVRAVIAESKQIFLLGVASGLLQLAGFTVFLLALKEGALAIVYTINSLYILIPIILSIIIYKEHWNARKVAAIVLSIVALAFLK